MASASNTAPYTFISGNVMRDRHTAYCQPSPTARTSVFASWESASRSKNETPYREE